MERNLQDALNVAILISDWFFIFQWPSPHLTPRHSLHLCLAAGLVHVQGHLLPPGRLHHLLRPQPGGHLTGETLRHCLSSPEQENLYSQTSKTNHPLHLDTVSTTCRTQDNHYGEIFSKDEIFLPETDKYYCRQT